MEILVLVPRKPVNPLHGSNGSGLVVVRFCQTLSALALQIIPLINRHCVMWEKGCGPTSDCYIPTCENLPWSFKKQGFLS